MSSTGAPSTAAEGVWARYAAVYDDQGAQWTGSDIAPLGG